MKKIKKPISILLSVLMVFSVFAVVPFTASAAVGDVLSEDDYLTFTAEEAGSTVTLNYAGGTLQYKINNSGWVDYTKDQITLANAGDYVRFSGNNTTFNESNHVSIGGKVACSGNVMSLRLDDTGKVQGLSDRCFYYMFNGCTGLTAAPKLPETTLKQGCYNSMFYGCTSLTTAPALPATTLASYCYSSMFSGCTSLTAAPALPATTLATRCYNSMFSGCTSLTAAPALPATTLAEYCYYSMFYGCTSLTAAPALPATELVTNCYRYMFSGCTGIKLSTEQTAEYSIPYRVPPVGTGTTTPTNAFKNMFDNTGGTFKGTPEINKTYYMYGEVPKYTITWKNADGSLIDTTEVEAGVVPTHDDATKEADAQYTYTFAGWEPTPVAATANAIYTATFTSTRKGINGSFGNLSWNLDDNGVLTFSGSGSIPNYGFDWSTRPIKKIIINDSVTAIGDCAFRGCTKLKEVVFESNPVLDWDAFAWCSALESVTLPQNMEMIGNAMFLACTSLKTIELPATIKKIGMSAFNQSGLESLTVPEGVEIGADAFEECASLQSLVLKSSTPVSYQAGYLTTLGDVTTVTVSEGSHYDRKARTDYNLTLKEGAEIPEWMEAEEVAHLVESANWTFNDCIEEGKSEEEALAEASRRMPRGVELEVHKTEIEAYDQIFRTGDTCPDVFGGATLKVALDDATIAAINAINAIGTVELTDACKEKVDAARAAYDALNDVQKTFVPAETLATLEAAEDAMKVVASVTTSNGTTTKYANFSDALNAWTDGSTLTLLADVQANSTINVTGTQTLDLNGYGIKMTAENTTLFEVSGNLTLNDSDTTKIHKFDPPTGTAGLATLNEESGSLEIHGGYITGFKGGQSCYVIHTQNGGSFTMNGGNLIGNEGTKSGSNCAVVIGASGNVTMTGGAIIYNTSGYWGAAINAGRCLVKITGGTIAHNYSKENTGAIYCHYLEMSGGSVTDNVAAKTGQSAGITVEETSTLGGNPVIKNNTDSTGASNLNVYMNSQCSTITSNLGKDACIGITMQNGSGVFTNSTDTSFNDPTKFFSDKSNYIVGKNAAGQLLLGVPRTVTWNMDDEIDTTQVAHGGVPTHANPTKPADDTNTYTFSGWKNGDTTYAPENLPEVTGDTTYTAQFTSKPKTLISGHSLTLDGDIGINFYIDPSVADMTADEAIDKLTYTLEWETQGIAKKPLTVKGKAIAPNNKEIIVTCKVCAAEMTCGIKASFSLGTKSENEVYSVRKYCDEGILANNAPYRDNEKLYDLANAMLDYGAKAQKVFGVKTDDLANEGLKYTMPTGTPDFDKAVYEANREYSNVANVTLSGGNFKFATLVFLSDSTLRLYFENTGGLPTGSMTKWNDYYYMQKTDIPAKELDTLQEFDVNGTTLTYSALDYAKGLTSLGNDDYTALACALYYYNQAANEYFV